MALKGDLASVDLAQMFQMLALNKKVGLLSIQSPRLWKVLYFDGRGVTLYYNPHNLLDRTIAAFVRGGRIKSTTVEEIRAHASRNQLGLVEALLAGGYLADEDLEGQLRYELEEEIYDLFFCKDARFEFYEGVDKLAEREGVVDERFFFNTESVIMEAARRIDEWSYIAERIVSGLEVDRPSDQPFDARSVSQDSAFVYEAVDGRHNVARIVEVTGLPNFTVFKSLCQLYDGGYIVPLPNQSLVQVGRDCLAAGSTQDAINLFEKAIEQEVGIPDVHALAAAVYQSIPEYEAAIYHLKCDAEYRIAAGDPRTGAQRLQAAVGLVPTDLAARERLAEIALTKDLRLPDYDAFAEGKQLVELLLAAGEVGRVRTLLERLLHVQPDDLDLKKILVNVHSKAGDQARVVELYLSIADTLVEQHRPLEAVGYLQKILMLDRSRSDVSERVRSLYTLDERRRSRRRTMVGLVILSGLLVVLGAAYQYYDQYASADFDRIDVKAMLEANEFQQAEVEFRRFIAEHPLATAISRANEELARIGSLRLKREATQTNQRAARERELQQLRQEYKSEWRRHADQFRDGKPEAALQSLDRVRQLVAQAGTQDDHAWALEQQLESARTRLSGFLDRARDLRRRSDEELASGNVDNARNLALDLVTNYDITASARDATVPVRIVSRPSGARLLRGNVPLTQRTGGVEQPVCTPAIVGCGREPTEIVLQLDGFEPMTIKVDPRQQALVEVPMKVLAERRVRFPVPVSTGVGVGGGYVVAGLRTGQIGVAAAGTGQISHLIALGGLKAMDGVPVVVGDRAFFATNEGTLECWLLAQGRPAPDWPIKLANPVVSEVVARDGRLVFAEHGNGICCYDQASGRRMWSRPFDGALAGPPTIEHRLVHVAGVDGRIAVFDATSGDKVVELRVAAGVGTRVLADNGTIWFGGADARIHAVDETHGNELWSVDTGRVVADGELALTPRGVVVLAANNRLLHLDRARGTRIGALDLAGTLVPPLMVVGDRVLLAMRFKEGKQKPRDTLLALTAADLSLVWEHADAGTFTGPAGADGQHIAVAGADGEVVLLR